MIGRTSSSTWKSRRRLGYVGAAGALLVPAAAVAALWGAGVDVASPALLTLVPAALSVAVAAGISGRTTRALAQRKLRFTRYVAPHISECVGTGALLRRFFLHACERRIRAAPSGHGLAFFAVDMDYLKALNDSLGHEAGDAALRHLVDSIRQCAGPETVIGRLGGDEFAFLSDCATEDDAQALAQRLQMQFRRSTLIASRQLTLSVTIGVVLLPQHTTLLTEALQLSDIALYVGKNGGRSRSVLFRPEMLRDLRRDQAIERELRLALDRGDLRQLYSPTVHADGQLAGLRSVMQWSARRTGTVPYETFARIAEKTDLVDRLGEWSMLKACEDASRVSRTLPVAVTVRASQMRRDRIVESVEQALRLSGIAPQRLALLLCDAADWTRDINVERRLRALRALGIRISVDDVGAILCSADQANDLPVDSFRIRADRIARLGRSERENVIVTSLARTGKAMGLLVIAEGIETAEQLLLAQLAGCDRFAGPFFSGAMPLGTISEQSAFGRASTGRS